MAETPHTGTDETIQDGGGGGGAVQAEKGDGVGAALTGWSEEERHAGDHVRAEGAVGAGTPGQAWGDRCGGLARPDDAVPCWPLRGAVFPSGWSGQPLEGHELGGQRGPVPLRK